MLNNSILSLLNQNDFYHLTSHQIPWFRFYSFTLSQKINEISKLRKWNTNDRSNSAILKVVGLNAPILFHLDLVTVWLVANCQTLCKTYNPFRSVSKYFRCRQNYIDLLLWEVLLVHVNSIKLYSMPKCSHVKEIILAHMSKATNTPIMILICQRIPFVLQFYSRYKINIHTVSGIF